MNRIIHQERYCVKKNTASSISSWRMLEFELTVCHFSLVGWIPGRCHKCSQWRRNIYSFRSRGPWAYLLGSEERGCSPRNPRHQGSNLSILPSTRQRKASYSLLHHSRGIKFPPTLPLVPIPDKLLYYWLVWQMAAGRPSVCRSFFSGDFRVKQRSGIERHFSSKHL